jgi:hypothetical protein
VRLNVEEYKFMARLATERIVSVEGVGHSGNRLSQPGRSDIVVQNGFSWQRIDAGRKVIHEARGERVPGVDYFDTYRLLCIQPVFFIEYMCYDI